MSPRIINMLISFVDMFPYFTIGSNSDLPRVGVSILNHEHFQGGKHIFPLQKAKDKFVISLSKYKHTKLSYLDFYKAGYDRGIQNYLSMSLYDEDISVNDKLLNALWFFKNKEPRIYHLVNSLMRGNFDEMFRYMGEIKEKISIGTIIKLSQKQIDDFIPPMAVVANYISKL